MIRILITIILCVTIIGCANAVVSNKDTNEDKIVHVVLIWLKEPGNETHINNMISTTQDLKQIPEVQQLQVGRSIPSDRNIVDDSFDVGLYITFNSKESLENYLVHPVHKETVKEVIRPLSRKITVYDFQEPGYQ